MKLNIILPVMLFMFFPVFIVDSILNHIISPPTNTSARPAENLRNFLQRQIFLGAQETKNNPEYIGEIFRVPVPVNNYNFVKGTLIVFGNYWGPQPQTPQELEDCVWNDLVLSYEAFRRNVSPKQEDVDAEITKTLSSEKVDFDWKKDKDAYAKKIKEKAGVPVELFENQIRHLVQLKDLRKLVMDSIEPVVDEKETYQEFLNEYNSLSVELAQFDKLKDAENFYKKVEKRPKLWDKEKQKRPNDFKRPGFVSLEFLMDMWKFSKEDVFKMIKMKIGSVYPPSSIYKGYGVFRILEVRQADEKKYPELKKSYQDQIKNKKRYEGLNEWVKNLKKQADIKIYNTKREE